MQKLCIKGMLLSLVCLSVFANQEVERTQRGSFYVKEAGLRHRVESGMVDKTLRDLTPYQIYLLSKYKGIAVTQCTDGTYVLREKGNIKGGGPAGATTGAYIGKFIIHFIGHGTIAIVSACTGPAAAVTAASLEATFLPTIEAASNVGAIVGGIVGGVATGPV